MMRKSAIVTQAKRCELDSARGQGLYICQPKSGHVANSPCEIETRQRLHHNLFHMRHAFLFAAIASSWTGLQS